MQPPPCSCCPGPRSQQIAFEKQFGSAQWAENEWLGGGKYNRMLGQGLGGGWVMEERWLWTTAFPAPSRGRLEEQERRKKKHLTPSQEAGKTFKRDFSSTSHLYQKDLARKPCHEPFFHTHTQQLLFLRTNREARIDAMSIAKGKKPSKTHLPLHCSG